MAFGVFDGLHKGHLYFLREAAKHGELIVVVARDSTVKKLKDKIPKRSEKERLRAVRRVAFVYKTMLGDKKQSSYEVIKKHKPDIICLGYDQSWLKKDLEEKMGGVVLPKIVLTQITPCRPEELHTSLLNFR